jgi:two-component system sensor histidine kinase DesK
MHLAHTVAADAESIVTGTLRLDIASELTTARDALRAAGIAVTIDSNVHVIQAPLETQLAAVLREAIANVLRHSDARTCFIRIRQDDDGFVVDVKNDGVREGSQSSGGRGLANIRSRVTAVGGTMTAGAHGDGFTLVAHLPRATTVSRAVS